MKLADLLLAPVLVLALALGLAGTASAAVPPVAGFHFSHKDWEVACDNTGTCRAAGYHEERSESRLAGAPGARAAGRAAPHRGQR